MSPSAAAVLRIVGLALTLASVLTVINIEVFHYRPALAILGWLSMVGVVLAVGGTTRRS